MAKNEISHEDKTSFNALEFEFYIYDIVRELKYNDNIDAVTNLICATIQYIVNKTVAEAKAEQEAENEI